MTSLVTSSVITTSLVSITTSVQQTQIESSSNDKLERVVVNAIIGASIVFFVVFVGVFVAIFIVYKRRLGN